MNGRRFMSISTALGRDDADQGIVHRLFQLAAVDDQFRGIAQHMRRSLRHVFPILVAALAHDVQEQHTALSGIHHVLQATSPDIAPPGRRTLI
jgi:hypothetical protein